MARVIIAGCGYVGCALAERLIARGHEVWGIRRTIAQLPGGIRGIAADLAQPLRPDALPAAPEYLVFTAGASGHTESAYRQAYIGGLRNLLDAVDRSRLKRVLFTSSTAVYAQDDGEWVDEDSPTAPVQFAGRIMLESESLVAACGIPSVALRLGGIYGPGRTRLIDSVREGTARIDEDAPRYLNLNHRDDCAGALEHLMFLDGPQPLYLGSDPNPEDRAVILRWIADRLGVPHPPGDPAAMSRGGNKRCSSRRLVESGYTFQWPSFREGYGNLIGTSP